MLRLIHTADWHLGHSLHAFNREWEHQRFLEWLADLLETEKTDVLLVCGDIYDSANPPASAQRQLFGFLVEARRRRPRLQVVLIAGNHDSPARLEAPAPLLEPLGVRVVGSLPRRDGQPDFERLTLSLAGADGRVEALVAAVPYLRAADLPPAPDADDALVAGVERLYATALDAARARLPVGAALLVTGHGYLAGARLSELSERRILGGNQHAVPATIIPDDVAYAALGHLHMAQTVAGRDTVRYSGSPIPLALDEGTYPHQVVVVELAGGEASRVESRLVPRAVDVLRLPDTGALAPEELLHTLADLTLEELPAERWPLLDLHVRLERPRPDLRRQVEAALEGLPARLARLTAVRGGSGASLADQRPDVSLDALTPLEVFARRFAEEHGGTPPAELVAAFHELVEQVQEAQR